MNRVRNCFLARAGAALSVAAFWAAAVWTSAETLELKNGRKIEGRIVSIKERFVTIEAGGTLVTFPRDRVVEPDAAALLSQARDSLASGNLQGSADLCREVLRWHAGHAEARRLLEETEEAAARAESLPPPTPLTSAAAAQPSSAEVKPAPGIAPAPILGPRTLSFPPGWAIGSVFLRSARTANVLSIKQRDWVNGTNDPTWAGGPRAQGSVGVPPSREVMLRVVTGTSDLGFLAGLAEDDLYALQIEPDCPIDDDAMSQIARLTGLRELYIYAYDSKITGKGAGALTGLARLRTLDFSGAEGVRGNDLAFLSSLSGLRELNLYGVYIRSTDLDYIGDLVSLESLGLGNAAKSGYLQFVDADLKRLASLKALKSLDLYGAQGITGKGLGHLREAASLESLVLAGAVSLQDVNLAEIARFRNLKVLDLTDTPVTGKGLERLVSSSLVELRLGGADNRSILDADLDTAAQMGSLRRLRLKGAKSLTDAGLERLAKMTMLQELILEDLNVSASAVEALKTSLPDCRIEFTPGS